MSDFVIIFASTEGQTRKIASFVADHLRRRGATVSLEDVDRLPPTLDLEAYAGILIAASVHRAHHQPSMETFVRQHAGSLGGRHAGFISVSLSAAGGAQDLAQAREAANAFLEGTGWRPRFMHLAAGAFRYTRYGFLKRWIMRRIAEAKGAPTDTSRDHELTDWEDLERFVDRFSDEVLSAA